MKNLKGICLLLMLLAGGLPASAQGTTDEQMTVPLTHPGQPGQLSASLMNGSITVTAYDGKEVIIQVSGLIGDKEPGNRKMKNGMRHISSTPGGLTVIEEDNKIRIVTEPWQATMNLEIKVPYDFSLNLETANNGDVKVEGVTGEMEVSNLNGGIILHDVSGAAVVNTLNGVIEAVFNDIDPNLPMAFSTLNGDIDVTFPANLKAIVKVKTQEGDIYTDFDVEMNGKKETGKSRNGAGYKISRQAWVTGKVNGGGPEIMMKSMNGDIYIRKGK